MDDGIGLKENNLQSVFEPFFTTNRVAGNTGLGLHIVYNLVTQKLQGAIRVFNLSKGLGFEINLPIKIDDKST